MNITSVDQLLSFCPEMDPPVPAALKYFYKERILDDGFWLNFDAHEGPEAQLLEKLNQAYETGEFKGKCADINSCIKFIKLRDGSSYSRGQFTETILFKVSKEKDNVFSSLWLLTLTESFSADYDAFLTNLQRPDWYEPYRDQEFAKRQSYFAIYAYLSGAINREELLIINTVGAAYVEVAESFGKAEELNVKVVGKDELVDVLTKGNFPPYSPIKRENLLIRRKPDTEEAMGEILKEWEERSFVLRTVIDYPLDENPLSSDGDTYTQLGLRVGFHEGRVIALPPEFTGDLVAALSSCDLSNPKAHWFSFDYSSSVGEPFYLGRRIITVPSLLFPITRRPHNAEFGPPALTMLVHDINYHIFLAGNIPKKQRELIVEIAKSFNFFRSSHD